MSVFFTSDTHFGHKNIIEYCNRPFKYTGEMNTALIKNWNNVVRKNDIVYHLGDFSIGLGQENIADIVKRLNGSIYLIKGNHDQKSNSWYRECGFKEVYDHPIILNDKFLILSHEPMPFVAGSKIPYVNVFGHVHDSEMFDTYRKGSICVCVERHDYTPISFEDMSDSYYNAMPGPC